MLQMRPSLLLAVATLALILPGWGLPMRAAAQEEIRLLSSSVESQFPQGILFRVEVSGPREIADITLRFQVLGQRAQRYDRLEFTPSPSVDADLLVRTDTADRYIPPGAELEYRFEIRDAAGGSLVTSTQRFTLLDPRFDWHRIDQEGVSILYYGPLRERAQQVLEDTQATVERMGSLMGVEVGKALRLTMYNSWGAMQSALPPRSQVQEESLITEGVLFSSADVILLLASVSRVAGVTSHEVIHFLMDEAMGGLTRIVPAWLNEGLAEYGSTDPNPSFDRSLARALSQGQLLPITSLTTPPGHPEDIILMYGQGKSIVAYMMETYGVEPFRALLQNMRQGLGIDEALEAAYGFDRNGLDSQWRQAIGAPPLPVGGAQQARPTPIPYPTIVPFGAETPTPFPSPLSTPEPSPDSASSGTCGRNQDAREVGPLAALALGIALARRRRTHS